jgi:hypothetical protein
VDHAFDLGIPLVNLTVDVPFDVTRWAIRVNGARILNPVFDNIRCRRQKGRRNVSGHQKGVVLVWVADRKMPVGIEDPGDDY